MACAAAIAVAGASAGLCAMLWSEWAHNPDLSHGFLAPVIFLLLVSESRRVGQFRWLRRSAVTQWLQGAGLLGALALFALAGLFAASVGWSHALVLFLLALSLAVFSLSAWLSLADARIRLVPFNWIAFTAVTLWVLVAPIPTGTYYRLTLTLQNWVTSGVMNVLQFFGIPARQHGNVIELAHATVGVAEACSGIRSLIACVYAGFFFAAWQLRWPGRRLFLVVLAPLLALGMNFLRSLLLTLLADRGVNIGGHWHDLTGYAILALTAAILAAVAYKLETPDAPVADRTPTDSPAPARTGILVVASGLALVALGGFFTLKGRAVHADAAAPVPISDLLPSSFPGWEVRTADDLFQFSGILETSHLLQRTYLRRGGPMGFNNVTVYIAYWPAGQTSVSRVALHTPDACWPGAGWVAADREARHALAVAVDDHPLAPAEYRLFRTEAGVIQNVWFWHVFDGRVLPFRDPYSLRALLDLGWKYGFKRQGSQYFVRISSTESWETLRQEPLLRDIAMNLGRIGI